eukprot:Seg2367.2 transcript_id=Seg2367.2/GoldUCD/mRNA.D3Y31 product="NIF3-like protein 1" protein_id=Seg2367.2/GoldUCD/D3Y31
MVIIYMLIYGQSQKANSFQIALSRTLKQFGISEQGLMSLRNLGIAAHPHTVKAAAKSSASSHPRSLVKFFQDAVSNEKLIVVMIDDYHNIHTKHRPKSKTQTNAVHMSTLLVKVFNDVDAISKDSSQCPLLSREPVQIEEVQSVIGQKMPLLCSRYAENMPDWIVAKYFDPASERQRLVIHDYQQTEIQKMRFMDGCKLVDCIEAPLKSSADILSALNYMLANGLSIYLSKFLVPFVGDWPTQFYMRQIAYCDDDSVPSLSKHIAPLIGPLHISLNARECVVINFHPVFAELYSYLFGQKAKLAKKPRPWRISLLLEVSSIAVCAGSGGSVLRGVSADLYLTGEMSHHEVLHATESGRSVILCDHSNTERGFLKTLPPLMHEWFNADVSIEVSTKDRDPLTVI